MNLVTAAALLDPRISYETLREDYADEPELLSQLEVSKVNLQTHFEIHYAPTAADVSSDPTPQADAGSPQKIDFTNRYKKRGTASISGELAEYFRITSVPEPFEVVDPLQWWYSRRRQFPNLYRLVRNILCTIIPPNPRTPWVGCGANYLYERAEFKREKNGHGTESVASARATSAAVRSV